MKKVITYGTYDLLHYGHIRLLERAKKLGDYLIVGVTSDDFDKKRGKINVQQSLMERIEAVKKTGIADEIIVEEYEGQKIDDIIKYDIDIFTLGSDWVGKFDYLNDYCKVIYLDRTEGVSSTELRTKKRMLTMGIVGNNDFVIRKIKKESEYVNGIKITSLYSNNKKLKNEEFEYVTNDFDDLLKRVDSVYINSDFKDRYIFVKKALENKRHVLCESPICLSEKEYNELYEIAKKNNCILMDAIKTAYSIAYNRLCLLLKSGKIGDVIDIDVTCTSLKDKDNNEINSLKEWGPIALLPIFQLFGTNYNSKIIMSRFINKEGKNDSFTKIHFIYPEATATLKVAERAKSEGELVITGTKGYVIVPSPWWKTDYFEIRYENQSDNKRYYYQLDGEGIRYELVSFVKSIETGNSKSLIDKKISNSICKIIEDFENNIDVIEI